MLLAGLIAVGAVNSARFFVLQQQAGSAMASLVESRRKAVDELLGEMKSEARRMTDLEVPNAALADYRADKGGLEELRAASIPVFESAIKEYDDLLGIARCSTAGGVTVEAGEKVPRDRLLLPKVGDGEPVIHGPYQFGNAQRVIVGVPVLDGNVSEGTDAVLFSLSGLMALVRDYSGLGEGGEVILGASRGKISEIFFSLRAGGEVGVPDPVVAEALGRTMRGEAGKIGGKDENGEAVMVGYAPLREADWGLLVRIPEADSSHSAGLLNVNGLVISGVAFLGTMGILFLFRPRKSARSFARGF